MSTAAGVVGGFDVGATTALVKECVRRHRAKWAMHGASYDDVVQGGVVAVYEQYRKFDPAKGAYSTFVNRIVTCDILDLARRSTSRRQREAKAAAMERTCLPVDDGGDLAREFREAYEEIVSTIRLPKPTGPRGRGRPRLYTTHQVLAIRWLERRLGLSVRGTELVLHQRPELREAIGLGRVPGFKTVHRGRESVSKMRKYFQPAA